MRTSRLVQFEKRLDDELYNDKYSGQGGGCRVEWVQRFNCSTLVPTYSSSSDYPTHSDVRAAYNCGRGAKLTSFTGFIATAAAPHLRVYADQPRLPLSAASLTTATPPPLHLGSIFVLVVPLVKIMCLSFKQALSSNQQMYPFFVRVFRLAKQCKLNGEQRYPQNTVGRKTGWHLKWFC